MVDKFKADVGAKRFSVKAKTAQDGTVTLRAKRDGVRGINFSSVQNRMQKELKKEVDKAGEDAKGLKKAGAQVRGFFKGAKKVLQHSVNKRLGQIKPEDMKAINAKEATVYRTASAEKELERKGFTREDLPREDILDTLLKSEPNAGASAQEQLHADVNSVIQNFAKMTYGEEVAGELKPETDFENKNTFDSNIKRITQQLKLKNEADVKARKVKAEKFETDIKKAAPVIIHSYFHEFTDLLIENLNTRLNNRIEGKLRKLGAESKECTADHKFAFNKPEIRAEMLAPILDRLEKANNEKLLGLEHLQEALNTLRDKGEGALTSEAQAEAQENITAGFEKIKHTASNIQKYRNELSPEKPTEVRKNIRPWKIIQDALKTKPSAKTANEAPAPVKTAAGAPDPAKTSSDASASNLPARPELVPSPFETASAVDSEIQPASPRAPASPRDVPDAVLDAQFRAALVAFDKKTFSPNFASSELSATPTVTLPTGRMRAQQPVVPSLAVPDPSLSPFARTASVKSDSSSLPRPGTTYQGAPDDAIDNASGDLARSASIKEDQNTYTPPDFNNVGSASVFGTPESAATSPADEKKNNKT